MVVRIVFIVFMAFQLSPVGSYAQEVDSTLRHAISSAAIYRDDSPERGKRAFLKVKKVKGAKRFNPFLYVSSGLIYVYQNVFSEQIQADCNYELSCSSYTKRSIERHGFFVGLMMGLDQLSACFAGVKAQYPEYKISMNDLIDNSIEE